MTSQPRVAIKYPLVLLSRGDSHLSSLPKSQVAGNLPCIASWSWNLPSYKLLPL